jgi:hypothetical protein
LSRSFLVGRRWRRRAKFKESQAARRQVRRDRLEPHHQRREFLPAEVRAAGLGTNNIDHHRTGDLATLFDALSGKTDALATTADLYTQSGSWWRDDLIAAASVSGIPGAREFPASQRAHLHGDAPAGSRGSTQREKRYAWRLGRELAASNRCATR